MFLPLVLLLVAAAAVLWSFPRDPASRTRATDVVDAAERERSKPKPAHVSDDAVVLSPVATPSRHAITQSAAKRSEPLPSGPRNRRDNGASHSHRSQGGSAEEDHPTRAETGDPIVDRDDLMDVLNRDFMPLATECVERARERAPNLDGLLVIDLSIATDENLGAILEAVDAADENEVEDADLFECIQQTMLSTMLPPPLRDGREIFQIRLAAGPNAVEDAQE